MIRYTPELMEDIRAAVVDGYYKLSHGGLEVGGVLFGSRARDAVEIKASRPVRCQHAYGPSFKLSEVDLTGLAELLESVRADPALAGMVPVGWYHSHTRSDPELSETDLEIHNRYFHEPWHVALVVRPERHGPTKAVFHSRDAEGVLRQEPALILEPAPKPPPPQRATPDRRQPEDTGPLPAPQQRSNRLPWFLFALAWLLAISSTAVAVRSYWWPKPPLPLDLTLLDINGQLSVQWDKSAPAILEADRGVIEIDDGGQKRNLELNTQQVRKGNVWYARQSGEVTATLRVHLPRGRASEGIARFVGQPLQHSTAPESETASPEAESLASEVQRLEAALAKQNQRNRDLEAAIAALRNRLPTAK